MPDPVGEDGWLALVDELSRIAGDLENRVGVVEEYKRAIAAEPWSNKLWLAYCEWVWSLHTDCQNADAGWPEEEQLLGQELFSLETAIDVWQQGAQATQYRLSDSHELWNRWMSIELEQLGASPDNQKIERVQQLFLDRLQVPHATWDETSQMFSTFISKYKEADWEDTMVKTTKLAKAAKDLYSHRESHELKLQRAIESGNSEAVKSEMINLLGLGGRPGFKTKQERRSYQSLDPVCRTIRTCIIINTPRRGSGCLGGLHSVSVNLERGSAGLTAACYPTGHPKSHKSLSLVRDPLGSIYSLCRIRKPALLNDGAD